VSLRDKYSRPKPQEPPKKKGNSDVISKIVQENNKPVDTETQGTASTGKRKIKKATFELNADLHKRLRTFAAINDTTMVDIVEMAVNEYLDKKED